MERNWWKIFLKAVLVVMTTVAAMLLLTLFIYEKLEETGFEEVDIPKANQLCQVDSAYLDPYSQDWGKYPGTWLVALTIGRYLPLEEGSPTILGLKSGNRYFVVQTWNSFFDDSTMHDHYEIRQCVDEEAARWYVRMLQNPDFLDGLEGTIHLEINYH